MNDLQLKYLFTFGESIKIYSYGCLRIGIKNGKQVLGYVMPKGGDNETLPIL